MGELKPFLKWAGGKQHLTSLLLDLIPKNYNRYFEPFLGSGALFFSLSPERAVLGDVNTELIATYNQVRDNVESVIRHLKKMRRSRRAYYQIRARRPTNPCRAAARMIYLNRNSWNGLYRVNKNGKFNVPFGEYKNPTICDSDRLLSASKALAGAKLLAADFHETAKTASRSDLVYLDPPYRTTDALNGFLKYNSSIFSWSDQLRLASLFHELDRKGSYVILTNAVHKEIKKLYQGYPHRVVLRRSLVAADPSKRRPVLELLVKNF